MPNGSIGHRWGEEGDGHWNLELGDIEPRLSLLGAHDELVELDLPRFDIGETEGGGIMRRGVPAKRIGDRLVTTVFDLLCAQLGVAPRRPPRRLADGLRRSASPGTPAWQQEHTDVDSGLVTRIAREFARNAEVTEGRSMIVMGAGTNHWFHGDQIYRGMLSMLLLCGCQGVNGGGWAHYVGQEKVRPITGFGVAAFATDWTRPPRQQATTSFWYLATDQWRYERFGVDELTSPLGDGALKGKHFADTVVQSARMGWLPSYPTLNRNPLDLCDEAAAAGKEPAEHVVDELQARAPALRRRGPRRPGELPARADAVAGEPARLVVQGARVLPQAPARRRPARR